MFKKSVLFLSVLTILKVSARYKNVVPDIIDDEINPETTSLSSSRIVSGWVAQPGQHPHHAALRMVASNGGMNVCGGSIISNEWVLTSARCTASRVRAVVRVGVVNINDSNPTNIFETTEWYNHPKFNNLSTALQSHGVTLLKLPRPVVYTWLLKPIRIQSSADAYRNYNGEQVYASGHGRTEFGHNSYTLRWVYLRAISNNECKRSYPSSVFDTTICARYLRLQSSCMDDIGGPLVHVSSDGIPTLIGITFFFPAENIGCRRGWPTPFYRPGAFIPWFKEVTGIDFDTTTTTTTTTSTNTTFPTTLTTTLTNTPTTITTPTTVTAPSTTTTRFTTITTPTTTIIPNITTDSNDQDFTPEDNITAPPEEEEEDSDSSECNDDDEIGQLLKRLQVDVKVKVALNKYKVMKINDTNVLNH